MPRLMSMYGMHQLRPASKANRPSTGNQIYKFATPWKFGTLIPLPAAKPRGGAAPKMAAFLSKSTVFSGLRSRSQQPEGPSHLPRRGYHIDLGAREKALLEEDPALKRFKSYKKSVKRVSKAGDVLTILVVAACSYQIYAVASQH